MTQHYWLVFKVPWTSKYFEPEVAIQDLTIYIHEGLGWYYGNVSHLVVLTLWTNTPQTVKVLLKLFNVDTNETIASKTLTLKLQEGVNVNMTWFSINASKGMKIRAYAKIIEYEADTNPDNNELWSGVKQLRAFIDFRVFAVWRVVRQKIPGYLLPGDEIEVGVCAVLNINTSSIPATLRINLDAYNLTQGRWSRISEKVEEIRTLVAGKIWRNFTVIVPWTHEMVINASIGHPWELNALNNNISLVIPVDPDVELVDAKIEGLAPVVMEGSTFATIVKIRANVPKEIGAISFISFYDNTTQTLFASTSVKLAPEVEHKFEVAAPENPKVLWELRAPYTVHRATLMLSGYDVYLANNNKSFTFAILSYQFLWLIAIIIIVAIVFAAIRAVTHTIAEEARRRYRFVRRKGSRLGSTLHSVEERREERRFVRRKE